jgi:tetratricopeptide (TPR) repeat protein
VEDIFMAEEWNDKKFNKWLKLREKHKKAKSDKNFQEIISISKEIIELDKNAKFIGIMTPLFQKDMADAYLKISDYSNASIYYKEAINSLNNYRNINDLNNSDSFLKEISSLEKKLTKLDKMNEKN